MYSTTLKYLIYICFLLSMFYKTSVNFDSVTIQFKQPVRRPYSFLVLFLCVICVAAGKLHENASCRAIYGPLRRTEVGRLSFSANRRQTAALDAKTSPSRRTDVVRCTPNDDPQIARVASYGNTRLGRLRGSLVQRVDGQFCVIKICR